MQRFGRFKKQQRSQETALASISLLGNQVIALEGKLPVFKTVSVNVVVTNVTVAKVQFTCHIPEPHLAVIKCSPSEFTLGKGKSQEVSISVSFLCTTTLQKYVRLELQPLGVNAFVWLTGQSDVSFELDANEIEVQDKIGAGGAASVFRGRWRGIDVACKKILTSSAEADEGHAEAKMLCLLSHPNILQFYGMARQEGVSLIVTELCQMGSLRDVLEKKQEIDLSWYVRSADSHA